MKMSFIGRVYEEEPGQMRGSLTLLSGDGSGRERILYFRTFDDLKKMLENEYQASLKE